MKKYNCINLETKEIDFTGTREECKNFCRERKARLNIGFGLTHYLEPLKAYEVYRVVLPNIFGDNITRYLRKRLTKKSNQVRCTQVFGHVFSTKKGAMSSINTLKDLGYTAELETIIKYKK